MDAAKDPGSFHDPAVVIFTFAELGFVYFYYSANSAYLRLRGNILRDPLVYLVEELPDSVLCKVGSFSSSLHREVS